MEFKSVEHEPPVSKLKLAIVGPEKNGKSRLASTARKPVFFHDFDNRSEALNGIPGVFVMSYPEKQWPKQPEAAQDFLTNLGRLEENLDLSQFGDNAPKNTICKTNVVDSIQTFGAAFQRYALYNSSDIRRELTFAGQKVFLPKSFDAWNAEMISVENAVLRLLALPTDTIIILHETAEESADSTSEKPKYTGRIGVYPPRYQRLIKYFNEVWRVKLTQVVGQNNKPEYLPRVYPRPTYEFDSATTMDLAPMENPNITELIAKQQAKLHGASQKVLAITK